MDNNTFFYRYSAEKNKEVESIRNKYLSCCKEESVSELDELRALDASVKRPANIFSYVFGTLGAIIMGAGMSLVMTELGATLGLGAVMAPGIIIGVLGLAITLVNYPIHRRIMNSRKRKYASEILALSDKIINQ